MYTDSPTGGDVGAPQAVIANNTAKATVCVDISSFQFLLDKKNVSQLFFNSSAP